jgi:hypothetical protein
MQSLRKHLPMVAVAGITVVLATTGPVIGHGVNHARFAHNAGKLDDKDSSEFVQNKGVILYSVMGPWESNGGGTEIVEDLAFETVVRKNTSGTGYVILQAALPVAQFGKRMRVLGVEICTSPDASTDNDVTVDNTAVIRIEWTGSGPGESNIAMEAANSTTAECRVVKDPTGSVLTTDHMAAVRLTLDWDDANNDPFYISRTTFIMKPTNQTATAPT